MKVAGTLFSLLLISVVISCDLEKTSDASVVSPRNSDVYSTEVSRSGKINAELILKDRNLKTGYNALEFRLSDRIKGKELTKKDISAFSLRISDSSQSSVLIDNEVEQTGSDSIFRTGVLFAYPAKNELTDKEYVLRAVISGIHLSNEIIDDTADFTVQVRAADNVIKWTGSDSIERIISLIEPSSPQEGSNPLELYIAWRKNGSAWKYDSLLGVSFIPTMPEMGHSSPYNVNPVHFKGGHYRGTVNFTMSGFWRLTFRFVADGKDVTGYSDYLDLTF